MGRSERETERTERENGEGRDHYDVLGGPRRYREEDRALVRGARRPFLLLHRQGLRRGRGVYQGRQPSDRRWQLVWRLRQARGPSRTRPSTPPSSPPSPSRTSRALSWTRCTWWEATVAAGTSWGQEGHRFLQHRGGRGAAH